MFDVMKSGLYSDTISLYVRLCKLSVLTKTWINMANAWRQRDLTMLFPTLRLLIVSLRSALSMRDKFRCTHFSYWA